MNRLYILFDMKSLILSIRRLSDKRAKFKNIVLCQWLFAISLIFVVDYASFAQCAAASSLNIDVTNTASTSTDEDDLLDGDSHPLCKGSSFTLDVDYVITPTASPSLTYKWDGDANNSTQQSVPISNITTTTDYTVEVTDADGTCEITITIEVIDPPTITINSPDLEICEDESTTLTAFALGSTSYTYSWSPTTLVSPTAANTETITVATTSSPPTSGSLPYTVTVTNANGCTAALTETIVVNPLPTGVITVTEASGSSTTDMEICNGDNATLVASGGSTYVWNAAAGNATGASVPVAPTATATYMVTVTDANGCTDEQTKAITVNPLPTVTIAYTNDGPVSPPVTVPASSENNGVICIGSTAELTATPVGTSGYTYMWDDPSPTTTTTSPATSAITISPTTTTTYNVTVTDDKGCTVVGTDQIIVNNPTTTITHSESSRTPNDMTICLNETVDLMASGGTGTTYEWSSIPSSLSTTGSPITDSPFSTGTEKYTVIATDTEGCTTTDDIDIEVVAVPTADITATDSSGDTDDDMKICSGENATLTATGGGTYAWTTTEAVSTLSAASGAVVMVAPVNTGPSDITVTYEVVVTAANGCTAIEMIDIEVHPLPTLTISPKETSGTTDDDAMVCDGDGIFFNYSGSVSSSPYTYDYNWSDGPVTMTGISATATSLFFPTANQTFSVTVTDDDGCTTSGISNVMVKANPIAMASMDQTICPGTSATISATGGSTYLWDDPSNSTTASVVITPTATNTYTVTVTNADGCTDTDEVIITVSSGPTVTISETDASGTANDDIVCLTESADLTANPVGNAPFSYAWSPSIGLSATNTVMVTATPTTTTTYTVVVTDVNGCTNETDIELTVNSPTGGVNFTETSGTTNDDGNICIGEVILTATGGASYQWDANGGNSLGVNTSPSPVSPTATTTYTVTVTDVAGCTDVTMATVNVSPLPITNPLTLQLCDDGDGNGMVDFNLTDAESTTATSNVNGVDVDNGVTATVTYHSGTPADGTNILTGITSYSAASGTTVYALVEDANGCLSEALITLSITALPMSNPVTLELCDDGSGGATFDLTEAENATAASNTASGAGTDIDDGATGVTITYHTGSPASTGNQVGSATAHVVTGPTTITALITDGNGCSVEETLTLAIAPLPTANAVTLQLCDDGDGIVDFDLTDAEDPAANANMASGTATDIDGSGNATTNGYTITYHTASPPTTLNEVPASTAHPAMNGDVITALLTSPDGCTSETTVTLNIDVPIANTVTLELCADISGNTVFNLTGAEDPADPSNVASGAGTDVDGGTNNTVTYHTASPAVLAGGSGANQISSPTTYSIANGTATVVALVTANPGGCTSEAIITLNTSAPIANDVTLEVCGSGTGIFNLTDSESTTGVSNISGTDVDDGTTNTVTYHTSPSPATSGNIISNPTMYSASNGTTIIALVKDADDCVVEAEITLMLTALPTTNDITLELCDDGTGNATFDLTAAEATGVPNTSSTLIVNPTAGNTVTYHTASPATTANQVPTSTAHSAPTGTTIVALVTDPMSGCTDEAEVTLNVLTNPVANNVTLQRCDDGDGMVDFDLTHAESATAASNVASGTGTDVDNMATGITVTYHTASPAIVSGAGANQVTSNTAHPATNGTTIIALLTDVNGCTTEATVTLNIVEPIANAVTLVLCDDGDGNTMVNFDLTDAEDVTDPSNANGSATDVDDGTTNTVDYYTATGSSGPIGSPTAFPATNGMVIFAVVTDAVTNCTNEAMITLNILPLPVVNPVTLQVCDDGSGNGTFDLTEAESATATSNVASGVGTDVDNGATVTVTYHTATPATTANQISTPTTYSTTNGTMVHALVTDANGCAEEAVITLNVIASPVANAVTLQVCDDGTGNGIFDLSDAENATAPSNTASGAGTDVNGTTTNPVTYHTATPATATNALSAAAVANYTASTGTIIYALVTSTNGCTSEAMITLNLQAPIANDVTLELCDDGSGTASFTLTDAENPTAASNVASGAGTDVDNAVNANTVTYHFTSPATTANAITSPFTASHGTVVYALVEDAVTGCMKEASITLNVAGPPANDITLVVCDDGDGTVDFNLTDAENAMATTNQTALAVDNGSANTTVSYHTGSPATGTNLISISTVYPAIDGATVTALITSRVGCTSEATITLSVPDPMVSTGTDIEVCEGDNITLTGTFTVNGSSTSVANYSWAGPNGFTAAVQNPPAFASTTAAAGTYTLTITDNNGCTASDATIVVVNPAPTVILIADAASQCFDSPLDFNFTGTPAPGAVTGDMGTYTAITGLTDNGNGTASLSITTAGVGTHTITYTYKDDKGCTAFETSTVEIFALPVVAPVDTDVCIGSTVNIDGLPSGGSGTYTNHTWTVSNSGTPSTGATNANITTSTLATATFDATGLTAGTVTLQYSVTDDEGCTNMGTVDVEIHDNPTAAPVASVNVCVEDQITIDGLPSGGLAPYTHAWTITNDGGTTASDAINLTGANTSMVTFDATILTPGTATLEYTVTDANGCTDTKTVSVIVDPLPATLSLNGVCNIGLTMYDVEIQMGPNDTIVSASPGTLTLAGTDVNGLDSFLVSGITSGATFSLVLRDTLTECLVTQTTTINCNCDPITPPDSIRAEFACVGDSSLLLVSVDSTETVDWYDVAGTLVAMGDTSLWVTTAGSYFAETRDTISRCTSATRTEMVFDFHSTPSITLLSDTCDATFSTYSIIVTSSVDSIIVDTGMVASIGTSAMMDTFEITNIPITDTLMLTAVDTATGCVFDTTFIPPVCACPMLVVPTLSNDTTICASDSIPTLIATVGTNQTACWLDNATGDTLALNSISYTPTVTGVFAVVAKDTFTNCTSDTARVALVINPLPAIVVLDTVCNTDLTEYTILFSNSGTDDSLSTNMGILDSIGIDSFVVRQIPDDSTVVITVVDTITGCSNAVTITNNCSCINTLIAPVAAMDTLAICPGDSIALMVSVDSTETVDWYDTSGGLLLAGDTAYTTGIAGTYLAVTRDTVTACTGTDSTAVVLEIHTPPTATINNLDSIYCENDNILLSSDTLTNVVYDWSTNGSAVISDTAAVAPFFSMMADGEVITLMVTDTVTGCMAMTTDTLRVDTLPTISAITVACGMQQDSFDITIATDALTVSASHGTVAAGNNPYTIVGIPRDSVVTLTLGMAHCSLDTIIQPPAFPTVTGLISSPICPGEAVSLAAMNTTADSLVWTTTGAGVFDTLSGPMANVTGAVAGDVFVITAMDTATGCVAVDRDTLEELVAPLAPVVVNQIVCKDDPATFTAVVPMGQTINWFDTIVGGTPILVGPNFTSPETTSGTYTYYAQAVDAAGNGCVSGRTAFTLTILPLPNPNLAPTAAVCPGDSVTLTPGLFNSYSWSTGATTATITVGPGIYSVEVTDANGCTAVSAVNVDTIGSQNLALSLPSTFCTSDTALTLTGGSPSGGSYVGAGVSGGVFDPAVAGVGTHTITYAFTGAGVCTESINTQVTVMAPTATSLALANIYCASDTSFVLSGGSPAGGIYSGVGVTNGTGTTAATFDLATAGPGTHIITYTIGTGTSCVTSSTDSIVVEAVPVVSYTPVNTTTLCIQAGGVSLQGGSPAGGTYSGTGVTNGVFDPASAGIGTHTITYTVGSGNCTASATATYTVTTAPTVGLQLGTTQVCNNAGGVTLSGGTPAGGTYSGTGVTNGVFDPTGLGAGNYTITYNYSAAGSCTGTATATMTVAPTGNVSFTAGVSQLCISQGLFTLSSGSPAGGTFSGTGVVGNTFNPATAGAGTHTITYTGPASTCFGTITSNIVVIGDTPVSFNMTPPNLCSNSGPVPLTGGSPAGGTYSGPGVTNGSFDPTVAGAGTHTISYATACSSATMTLEVRPQLTASLNLTRTSVCSTESSFTLSGGSPASTGGVNGTYSGQGVVNNTFDPASVGPGTYPITYTLNPGFGCTGTATQMITVTTPGTSSLSLPTTNFCTTSSAITLSGGSPAGGTYSGNGVSNGVFNPATAGAGTHTISYSSNGCSSGASATVVVASSQGASFNLPGASICDNAGSFALSGGFPAGGTYSGTGVVSGNVFDPSTVSPGTYTITYTVSDACAGTTSATSNITVGGSNTGTLNLNNAQFCASSAAFVLTGGFPAGGTYSGTGVVGGNTFDPSIAGAGTHTINYNPNDGCSGISTGVIIVSAAPPTPVLRMATEICIGEDLLLEANAVQGATSYSWTGPNGFTSFLQNPVIPNVSTLNRGTYNLVVNVGSCTSAMSSLNINVNNLPDPVTVSSTGTICQGSNFDLIVNNPTVGDTYTWYYQTGAFVGTGASLNLSSTNNAAGRYYVTTNRGGCVYDPSLISNAPSFAFTDVIISTQSAVGAFAGQDATVCSDTYDLNALVPSNANIFGSWSTLVNSPVNIADPNLSNTPVFNLQSGNNVFIWTLSNAGCLGLSSDTVVINYATAPVLTNDVYSTVFNTPLNVDVLSNDQFTTGFFLDSIYTVGSGTAVINGDQTVSFAPNNSFVGTEQLIYRVCNNFCPTKCATATADITVGIDTTAAIFLPNTITPNGDGDNDALIFPEVMQYPGSELIIFNRWGDEVYRSNNYQNDWYGFWQESNADLPVGTYFYVLNLNNTAKSRMSGYVYIQRD